MSKQRMTLAGFTIVIVLVLSAVYVATKPAVAVLGTNVAVTFNDIGTNLESSPGLS